MPVNIHSNSNNNDINKTIHDDDDSDDGGGRDDNDDGDNYVDDHDEALYFLTIAIGCATVSFEDCMKYVHRKLEVPPCYLQL